MHMGDAKQEPSMEDILASIKRIIADDSEAAAAAVSHVERTARGSDVPSQPSGALHLVNRADDAGSDPEEVLELTQPIDPEPSAARPSNARPGTPRETPQPFEFAPERTRAAPQPAPAILSEDATSASRQSLAALSALIVKPEEGGDNTLDGLVREMLRPMLKDWLDQRLPELVEALVEKEIARITGRTF